MSASFTDRRIRQILGYPAVFLGSSSDRAPSIYHLMSRLDLGDRVLYPQGGFQRLIEVIATLAEKHGARLHTGTTVTEILTGDGSRGRPHVTGVVTTADGDRSTLPADVVVGAADLLDRELQLGIGDRLLGDLLTLVEHVGDGHGLGSGVRVEDQEGPVPHAEHEQERDDAPDPGAPALLLLDRALRHRIGALAG